MTTRDAYLHAEAQGIADIIDASGMYLADSTIRDIVKAGFRRRRVITDPAELEAFMRSAARGTLVLWDSPEGPTVLGINSSGAWYLAGSLLKGTGDVDDLLEWIGMWPDRSVTVLHDPEEGNS